MGKLIEAVRKLGNKLTGKQTVESNSLVKVINDIADDYEGGGATYTAGTGIEITNENVINNTQDEVTANPTLAGTEAALTGLQVGDTKYAIPEMPHLYALSFNVSDMYYTIFTKISCGLNNRVINTNTEDYTEVTLTSEEQQLLQNAMNSALCKNDDLVIMNISGDNSSELYVNYNSTKKQIDCENNGNDNYSLGLKFTGSVLTITNNPNDDDINIYEEQLF